MPDDMNPYGIVDRLLGRPAPGSYLSLTHRTSGFAPDVWKAQDESAARCRTPNRPYFKGTRWSRPS